MELILCPGCDGFVGGDWTECRSCGHALAIREETPAEEPNPAPEEALEASESTPAPRHVDPAQWDLLIAEADLTEEELAELEAEGYVVPAAFEAPEASEQLDVDPEPQEPDVVEEEPIEALATKSPALADPFASGWELTPFDDPEPVAVEAFAASEPVEAVEVEAPQEAESFEDIESHWPTNNFSWDTSSYSVSDDTEPSAFVESDEPHVDESIAALTETSSSTTATRKISTKYLVISIFCGLIAIWGGVGLFITLHSAEESKKKQLLSESLTVEGAVKGWERFTDPKKQFEADLPGKPKTSQRKFYDYDATFVESQLSDSSNSVTIVRVPVPEKADWKSNDQILRDFLDKDTARLSGKMQSAVTTTQNAHRQLDGIIAVGDVVHNVRYFVEGDSLYVIAVKGPGPNGDTETFKRITDSFRTTLKAP